eukprot:scaffold620_cov282-Pinguiococcus_pyrenoidosus.AAC.13
MSHVQKASPGPSLEFNAEASSHDSEDDEEDLPFALRSASTIARSLEADGEKRKSGVGVEQGARTQSGADKAAIAKMPHAHKSAPDASKKVDQSSSSDESESESDDEDLPFALRKAMASAPKGPRDTIESGGAEKRTGHLEEDGLGAEISAVGATTTEHLPQPPLGPPPDMNGHFAPQSFSLRQAEQPFPHPHVPLLEVPEEAPARRKRRRGDEAIIAALQSGDMNAVSNLTGGLAVSDNPAHRRCSITMSSAVLLV